MFPEKKIFVINDIGLTENYLIYVDKIVNVDIDKQAEDYKNYFDFTQWNNRMR